MTTPVERMRAWIVDVASLIAEGKEPLSQEALQFVQEPSLAPVLIQMIAALDEASLEQDQALYASCLFALDVCVSQVRFAEENGNKRAGQIMDALMESLVVAIQKGEQSLNFWLPVLNAFYEAHVELSPALQDMYLALAEEESEAFQTEGHDHMQAIRDLIAELSDLSTFELAAHFFAQSHAMPADFFGDFVMDLCSIEEGQDAGLLALLHPRQDVRDVVISALDEIMPSLTLSSVSLSRLQAMHAWAPPSYQDVLTRWMREQRKKGVVFQEETQAILTKAQASEIDGGGAQGLFLQLKHGRKMRLAGVLFKDGIGIKDAWITPSITAEEVKRYCREVLDDGVTLRRVDMDYIRTMMEHFLALTLEQGHMPGLHFLELQEVMGVHFIPKALDVPLLMEQLSVQIEPFTPCVLEDALKRSSRWLQEKSFAMSWFLENERIDKHVNRCCSFEDGVRVCRFEEAMTSVFEHDLEQGRDTWVFHFLWVALWLRAGSRKNEKAWQDSFLIAHAIQSGMPLQDIPLMQHICHQSIVNSIETMRERRTHLSQE
jgi:hypothetical protein